MSTAQQIQDMVHAYAPTGAARDEALRRTLEDALRGEGKLYRASLIVAAGQSLGVAEPRTELMASAIEYFHGASLMLDDLPCMDNASLRRGRPCVHVVHGEGNTILAALSLISRAYLLCELACSDLAEKQRIRVHLMMERLLGASGLAAGQAADLNFKRSGSSARESSRIALLKTGGLFELSLLLPAMVANVSAVTERRLRQLAVYWSVAYQCLDDLRDVDGASEEEGKDTGRDLLLNRPNLVLSVGRAVAAARMARLGRLSLQVIAALGEKDPRWAYLGQFHRAFFHMKSERAAA